MGAGYRPDINNDDPSLSLKGYRIWPSYDLNTPTKRPLYHVTRSVPKNENYPRIKMSLPYKGVEKVETHDEVVKLTDVFNFVEKKRASSSGTNRRRTVEMGRMSAQDQLIKSRPQSCMSTFSKTTRPILSRRETMDSKTLKDAASYRPASVAGSNVSSFIQINCCELMGPSICTACTKQNAKVINRNETKSAFGNYKVTTENVATVSLVKRVLPFLTNSDIQQKLETGGISYLRPVTSKHADQYYSDDEEEVKKPVSESVKIPPLILSKFRARPKKKTTTPMFFHNIRELNHKIIKGIVQKDIGTFRPRKEEQKRSESPYPVFVSPKKSSIQEPAYKAYFEPPLLEKENQTDPFAPQNIINPADDVMLRQQPKRLDSDSEDECLQDYLSTSRLEEANEESTEKAPYDPPLMPKENQIEEPSFFAGSVIPYTLPERAPDKLGSFDINRMNEELSSSESDNER